MRVADAIVAVVAGSYVPPAVADNDVTDDVRCRKSSMSSLLA